MDAFGMDQFIQDVRVGLRLLAARPGFAAVAILTLALGIGANTAVFSVVNSVLLQPLPYPDSDGLLRVSEQRPVSRGRPMAALTNETYHPWLERTRTLDALAAYSPRAYTLTGRGEARRLQGTAVTASLFPMLRATPALGRSFTPDEEKPGANRVAILSHATWLALFAGDRAILGRTLTLDGNAHEIVGVMPAWFFFPDRDAELWTPQFVPLPSRSAHERSVFAFPALARLKPGVTLQQARAEGEAIAKSLFADAPRVRTPLGADSAPELRLIPLKDEMVRAVRPALLILTGVVALVLLVAAANLANLLLARGAARQREIAIRAAVGAGRGRLVRQLLTESVLLAGLGGVAGLILAWWLVRMLPAVAPQDFPRIEELALDGRVLLFTLVVSIATGVLFGLAPAVQGVRIDLTRALAESGGTGSAGFRFVRGNRTRLALAVGEIAIAAILLVGAGLLLKSFARLVDVDPGYDPANVLTARLPLPPAKYPTVAASASFYDPLLERIAALPDVAAVGLVNALPLSPGLMIVAFDLPNRPQTEDPRPPTANLRIVSAGYMRAIGLRLVEGRWLADTDRSGSRPVVLVNESFARTYFPGEQLVGRELPLFRQPAEVVGIVADVRHAGLDTEPQPEVYVTYHQSEQFRSAGAYLVVRSKADPISLVPALRAAVRSTDPDIALESVMTMGSRLSASVAQPRFYAALMALFAALAVTLAAVGIYGVLSYSVLQRRREIGVRMAMGAEPGTVLRLVLGQGAVLVTVGLAIGLGVGALLAGALRTLLFGVTPGDPAVFAGVAAVLGAIALMACYVPARRAARVDPLEALRYE